MKIIKTKTSDKIHLTGFLSEPKNKKGENIIVHIHGMSGDPYTNAWYPFFHNLYPKKGFAYLVGNHRGTGSITMFFQEPDKYPNYGNALEVFEDCVADIDAWVKYARKLGYEKIYLESHSFAPSKVVYYLSKKNRAYIKSLIFISPVDMLGYTLLNKNVHEKMVTEAKKLVKARKGNQMLSILLDGEYYLSAKTYLNLFSQNSNANVFCYTDRKHNWKIVNNINKPILLIGGTKDTPIEDVISTDKAFDILEKQLLRSPKVVSKIYKGAGHSFEGFEKRIVNDVVKFITRK